MDARAELQQSNPWIPNPDIILFSGDLADRIGVAEQHGLGEAMEHVFGKSKEVVKANWVQVVEQMKYLISHVDALTDKYELSEVQFKLGFSADGTIVFVAHGGINATISATFKRKDIPAAGHEEEDDDQSV